MIRVDDSSKQARKGEKTIFCKDIDLNCAANGQQCLQRVLEICKKIRETDLEIDIVSPYIITRQ